MEDAAPVGDDSNILAQPEPESGGVPPQQEAAPPGFAPGHGDGRSFANP